jgi:predicted MFS family arabinose efflux permease
MIAQEEKAGAPASPFAPGASPVARYAWVILLVVFLASVAAPPTITFAAAPEVMGSPRLAGIGLGVVSIGMNLGMVIGPVLFGMLVETTGWAMAGYWLIPVCILGFVAAWMVKVR